MLQSNLVMVSLRYDVRTEATPDVPSDANAQIYLEASITYEFHDIVLSGTSNIEYFRQKY
jgi:hypothetical protein